MKMCYGDGTYNYDNMDDIVEKCISNEKENDGIVVENYWKSYEQLSDKNQFEDFKNQLIKEINDLSIENMPPVESLSALVGSYVNLTYKLPNGINVKFLKDNLTYLGTQVESKIDQNICFGVVANMEFILVCSYQENGKNPELLVYKKR